VQPATVRDIQVEAKLRRPRGTTLSNNPLSKFPRRQGEPRINLLGQNIWCSATLNLELHPRHERSEKIYRASLTSNPASLLGKFQAFEADTHGG
jgi:hypothetical protein